MGKLSQMRGIAMGPNFLSGLRRRELEERGLFKVDFETVPYLVRNRKVLIKSGKPAYLGGRSSVLSLANLGWKCPNPICQYLVT